MSNTCLEKQEVVKNLFTNCTSKDQVYLKIIEIGKGQKPLLSKYRTEENEVKGCQSKMYLLSQLNSNGTLELLTYSDALISSGLAQLLVMVYSGETPEVILQSPPSYLEDLHISESLTPGRANGLYSLFLKIKQDALKHLTQSQSCKAQAGELHR